MVDRHDTKNGQSKSKAYETRDVKLRPLVVFVAGLAVVGVVVYLVVFLMLRLFSGQAAREDARVAPSSVSRPAPVPGEERLPPAPRIQANAAADMDALRRQEDARLTTYGWVDKPAGIVRLPIDVAMTRIVEEGLPVRQPDSAPPAAGTPARRKTPQGEAKKDLQ
ncbi:MAG: hypothetical protein R6V57_01340 [Vicinamibacterales bacterium]